MQKKDNLTLCMPLRHLFLANTFFTPLFCPNVLSLSKDYPALQAFSLGTRVFLSGVHNNRVDTAIFNCKKSGKVGANQRDKGRGRGERRK